MKKSLTDLTGAVNAILQQLRGMEGRLVAVEANTAIADEVRKLGERLREVESVELTGPEVVFNLPQGPSTEEELREIGKLPDCVKELRALEGSPTEYVSWVHSVEAVLRDYEIVRNKPIYRAILRHIRQKIRGAADTALVSYNVFDEYWGTIKRILSLHYADKRDIRILEHQLRRLSQRNSKLEEFYAAVNNQFSLIINKLKTEGHSPETVAALVETYRNRALDVFIRGLSGDMSRMLIVQKPKTLPEAYSACLELQNLSLRNSVIHVNAPNKIMVTVNQMSRQEYHPSVNYPPRKPFYINNNIHRFGQRPVPHF